MTKKRSDKTAEAGQATEADRIEVERLLDAHSKQLTIADMSPLLWGAPIDERWYRAFDDLEKRKQTEPLAILIETETMPVGVQLCLADLIRRKFNPKRGKRRTPLYDLPPKARSIFAAAATFRILRQLPKLSRPQALSEAAKQWQISEQTLDDHLQGKHSRSRDLKQQRSVFMAVLRQNDE